MHQEKKVEMEKISISFQRQLKSIDSMLFFSSSCCFVSPLIVCKLQSNSACKMIGHHYCSICQHDQFSSIYEIIGLIEIFTVVIKLQNSRLISLNLAVC
jgi:hypothetical protein